MGAIHFFKAHSRLGMINLPIHGTTLNIGVEQGPHAVITPEFLAPLEGYKIKTFNFSSPEDIHKEKYYEVIATESARLAQLIDSSLKQGGKQVVIGGDHSVAFPSLLALFQRLPAKNIGYIQFDSHLDLNTCASSPTGNFHGMFLQPIVGKFDQKIIEDIVPQKLPTSNILYIGNVEPDPFELDFIQKKQIRIFDTQALRSEQLQEYYSIQTFINSFDHIHISFDIDVFHHTLVAATGTPAQNGLFLEEIYPILDLIAQHQNISLDLVEVNPLKPGSKQTIKIAQEVIRRLLRLESTSRILFPTAKKYPDSHLTKNIQKNIVNQTANV